MQTNTPGRRLSWAIFASLLLGLLLFTATSAFAVELPADATTNEYAIETSGPDTPLTIGDWYTQSGAGNLPGHTFLIDIPCGWDENVPVTIAIFDPEVRANPTGVFDEVRNDTFFWIKYFSSTEPDHDANASDSTFSLTGPGLTSTQTYTTGTATDEAWIEFLTFLPATGAGCSGVAEYEFVASTTGNDDNSYVLSIARDADCTAPSYPTNSACTAGNGPDPAGATDDVDGIPGTGDELLLALRQTSYQHRDIGNVSCLDFYFFIDDSFGPTFTTRNFDLDINLSQTTAIITYTDPNGNVSTGTASSDSSWTTDTLTSVGGLWQAEICVNDDNQFIFEVEDGTPTYNEPPPLPTMDISIDDGELEVEPGQTLTYSIPFTNTSANGLAIDPIVTLTIPPSLLNVSCDMLAVPGSCTQVGNTFVFTLTDDYPAGSGGVLQFVGTVDPAFEGTEIDVPVEIDWTDILANNYTPEEDNDVDILGEPTAVTLSQNETSTPLAALPVLLTFALALFTAAILVVRRKPAANLQKK